MRESVRLVKNRPGQQWPGRFLFCRLRKRLLAGIVHTMKVTTEGQITIPQDIRERFHFFPGTDVEFLPQGDSVLLRPVSEKTRFQQWIERAQGSATTRLTTDEMMAATRGED